MHHHHHHHQGRELTVGGGRSNAKPANAHVEEEVVEEEEEVLRITQCWWVVYAYTARQSNNEPAWPLTHTPMSELPRLLFQCYARVATDKLNDVLITVIKLIFPPSLPFSLELLEIWARPWLPSSYLLWLSIHSPLVRQRFQFLPNAPLQSDIYPSDHTSTFPILNPFFPLPACSPSRYAFAHRCIRFPEGAFAHLCVNSHFLWFTHPSSPFISSPIHPGVYTFASTWASKRTVSLLRISQEVCFFRLFCAFYTWLVGIWCVTFTSLKVRSTMPCWCQCLLVGKVLKPPLSVLHKLVQLLSLVIIFFEVNFGSANLWKESVLFPTSPTPISDP